MGLGGDRACGIVGEAKVNQVGRSVRHGGHVTVGGGGIEVGDARVTTVDVGTGASRHDVGVDINGINRIGDGEADVRGEDLLDVAAIALRTVGDEDLVGLDPAAARLEIVLRDGLAQEGVALFGAVALERLAPAQFVGAGVQGRHAHGRQRLGDVADAEPDDRPLRVGLLKGGDAPGDVAEQIGGLQLGEIFVNADHERRGGGRWDEGNLEVSWDTLNDSSSERQFHQTCYP